MEESERLRFADVRQRWQRHDEHKGIGGSNENVGTESNGGGTAQHGTYIWQTHLLSSLKNSDDISMIVIAQIIWVSIIMSLTSKFLFVFYPKKSIYDALK